MGLNISRQGRRRGFVVGLVGLSAVLFSACQPGWINPLAGTGQVGSTGDGGAAIDATLQQPGSIVFEQSTGAYYVVDNAACVIRKVDPDGTISTVAGNGTCGYSGDGGPATEAQINPGTGAGTGALAEDASGNLYLADSHNRAIRTIKMDGTISTITSNFDAYTGPFDVTVSLTGTLYVAAGLGGVVTVDADGMQTQVVAGIIATAVAADPAGGIFFSCLGSCPSATSPDLLHLAEGSTTPTIVASLATSNAITDLSIDTSGNVYAVNSDPANGAGMNVVRIDPDGTVTTIAGNGSPDPVTGQQYGNALDLPLTPMGIAVTKNNGLLVSSGHVVYRLDKPATAGAPATTAPTTTAPAT